MTADTSKSLDLHAHPEVGASPAASKDGKDADVVDSRTLAAIRCARRFIIGDPAYEIGQTDARLILDRLSRETARAEAAEAEAKALREGLTKIATGPIVACPFESANCTVKPDEPCPVCGDVNDFDAPTNCGTGNARSIARATLAQPADGEAP